MDIEDLVLVGSRQKYVCVLITEVTMGIIAKEVLLRVS